jgi:hypothetical protein
MRLPFDDNATVDTIIADRQVLHADVEVVALAREFEQSGVPFRRIDSKLVTYDPIASGDRRRANTFHVTDDVDDIGIGHVWRGKPKVRVVVSGQFAKRGVILVVAFELARRTGRFPQLARP